MSESTPGQEEIPKRTREDRSKKLEARKDTDETVVKRCLLQAIADPSNKEKIVKELWKRVESCSRRVHLASLSLSLLVHECIEDGRCIPDIWNATFIRQLLLGPQSGRPPNEEIVKFFRKYPALLHNPEDRATGDGNIYTHVAKKIVVNLKNHLVMNTQSVLKSLLYGSFSEKRRDQAVLALFEVNGWKRPLKLKKSDATMDADTMSLVEDCRAALGLAKGEKMGKQWFKREFNNMLNFRVFAIKRLASLLQTYNKPRQLLPLSKIKRHFITLDTMGFWGLCKDVGLLNNSLYSEEFEEMVNIHWKSVFKIDQTQGRDCEFTGTVDTDGIVLNIHYVRPAKNPKSKKKEEDDNTSEEKQEVPKKFEYDPNTQRIVGCDPGRTNVCYIADDTEDGRYKTYVLTKGQYYRESGISESIRKSNLWNLGIKQALEAMSQVTPKTYEAELFRKYVEVVLDRKEELWNEYLKPRWARQRLRTYGGKKRVFARFYDSVNKDTPPGKQLVVAYGSAKFAPGCKGQIAAPVSRAYKECASRFPTHNVDEFRSTRVFYGDCETILQAVGRYKEYKKVSVRGLLWCNSTNRFGGKLVNRDLNAALNIRRCLIDRPNSMNRSKCEGRRLGKPVIRRMLRR